MFCHQLDPACGESMNCPICDAALVATEYSKVETKCPACSEAKGQPVLWSRDFIDGYVFALKKVLLGEIRKFTKEE